MTVLNHAHETTFRAYNFESEMISVTVNFNIDRDDDEVMEFGRTIFKKVYEIDIVSYSAHYTDEKFRENDGHCNWLKQYEPTEQDLSDWKHDIREALQKEFRRQTA